MTRKTATAILITAALAGQFANAGDSADRVLKNGDIYTVNPAQPHAEAIAIDDGKIIFVGSNRDAERYIGAHTQVDDLGGKFVLPGLIDTHAHYAVAAGMANSVILDPTADPETWAQQIKAFADEHPDLPGIVGLNVVPLAFGKDGPTREALDALVPDRPAVIIDEGGHSAWVNSKAYELAGIDKDTPDPVPGVHMYKRNADGEPSGWNLEAMTIFPLLQKLNLTGKETAMKGAEQIFPMLPGVGLTAYYDAGMMQNEENAYALLQALEAENKLPVKVVGSYMVQSPQQVAGAIDKLKDLNARYSSALIRPNTLKIHNDGTIEAETAALSEDYSDDPGNKGAILLEGNTLNNLVADAARNNFNVHVHAIGDRTISESLDAIEYARQQVPQSKSRYSLAHVVLSQAEDLPRFGELDVIAQTTPVWIASEPRHSHALGEERSTQRYRFKTIEDGGAKVTFGSDFPVGGQHGIYPLYNMEVGITRHGIDSDDDAPLPPADERLSLETMIKGYTSNAAYQLNMEDEIGTLEVGKAADIVVLDRNLFDLKPTDIHNAKVEMTIMNGDTTYQAQPGQ